MLLRVNAFNSHARIISKVKSGRILHSSGTERGRVTPGQKTPKNIEMVGPYHFCLEIKVALKFDFRIRAKK